MEEILDSIKELKDLYTEKMKEAETDADRQFFKSQISAVNSAIRAVKNGKGLGEWLGTYKNTEECSYALTDLYDIYFNFLE